MNSNRISRSIEIMWLILAVACLAIAVKKTVIFGFSKSYMFYVLSIISISMYSLRRYIRNSQKK